MDKQIMMRDSESRDHVLTNGWKEQNRSLLMVTNSGRIVAGYNHARMIGSLCLYEVLKDKDEQ
jgi:hypothetical protein